MRKYSLAWLGVAALAVTPAGANPTEGTAAPDFELKLFDGSTKTLADYRGKVLVINYWATWCGPCKAEMPMMDAFHRKNKHRGFEIVGVVTKDSAPKFRLAKVEKALSYPLASKLKGKYGTIGSAVPTTYIIDRNGVVRDVQAGSYTDASFRAVIEPLL